MGDRSIIQTLKTICSDYSRWARSSFDGGVPSEEMINRGSWLEASAKEIGRKIIEDEGVEKMERILSFVVAESASSRNLEDWWNDL